MHLKINIRVLLRASTLMEALVAMAITSIIMWMVFTSMQYRLLPVNPQRKLDAVFIADSLMQLNHYAKQDSLNLSVRNFKIEIITHPYNDTLQAGIVNINIYATPKHILVNRKKVVIYED